MQTLETLLDLFALDGAKNIVDDAHFGIVNGKITAQIPHTDPLSFGALYAPPFASSNFTFQGKIFGEAAQTEHYTWQPFQVRRDSTQRGVRLTSTITLIEGQRALVMEIALRNEASEALRVPLQFHVLGGVDYVTDWTFHRPQADKLSRAVVEGELLLRSNDTGCVALAGKDMHWEAFASLWKTAVDLAPGETRSVWFALAMGDKSEAETLALRLLNDPAGAADQSREAWARRAEKLLAKLPHFRAGDKRLEKFYYRSALHFLLNRWDVPEFALHPYYSTGSVNGGCICSYLWDFSEGWEVFPLVDPVAAREHIMTFLGINLARHFAFTPLSASGWGPWYPINQEKIVFLIYYYVLLTGDEAFLEEMVKGRSVIDWVIYHALLGDRLEEDANLIDYGNGNHHLELRREFRYDHFVPDLNARRYGVYLAAETLCGIAKRETVDLRDRAEKLKHLIRRQLWSDEHQWWFHLDPEGRKDLRYTIQMFKLIGSGVFDEEEESLIRRLNEGEFLSEFGLHSMSKKDPAYDQIDIDNGGGGACCCFPPQLIERLYKAGYPEEAEDVLRRILWWGERLPYWGDSLVANAIDYRRDTPLQNAIGAVSGAQCLIFGLFGIRFEGRNQIIIDPHPPSFSPSISLKGLHIRGMRLEIHAADGAYEANINGTILREKIGRPIKITLDEFGWPQGKVEIPTQADASHHSQPEAQLACGGNS